VPPSQGPERRTIHHNRRARGRHTRKLMAVFDIRPEDVTGGPAPAKRGRTHGFLPNFPPGRHVPDREQYRGAEPQGTLYRTLHQALPPSTG